MRTTLDLADDLMKDLLRATGATTKTAAVEAAIADFLRRRKIQEILDMRGKIDIDPDWRKAEALEIRDLRSRHGRTPRRRRH